MRSEIAKKITLKTSNKDKRVVRKFANDLIEKRKLDYDTLLTSLAEANKQNFQLLQDKVKLEGDIIALKEELNKQLKK